MVYMAINLKMVLFLLFVCVMRIMKENAFESSALFDAALSRETDQIMDDAARAYCRNLITRSGPLAFSAINFEELCETIQKCFITAESRVNSPDVSE